MSQGIVESQGHESQQQQQQQQGASRSKLVQRLLAAGANLPAFVNDLLTTQAVVVAGTEAAAFLVERQASAQPADQQGGEVTTEPATTGGELALRPIAHIRPDQSDAETRSAAIAAFQNIMRPCIIQGKDGALEVGNVDDAGEAQFCLVTLLRNEGQVVAASAVITRCRNVERARQRLMSMQLVAGYFELYSLKRVSEQSRTIAQSHQSVLQLATAVATADGFESAAMNLCNELATRTGASRVSIGWLKGRNIKVKALSHTEKFDKKQELIVRLQQVMEESLDQEEVVHFDPEGGSTQNVTRAAQELSRHNGGEIVLSLPLRRKAEIVGVATLEFPAKHRIGEHAASGLMVAVDLLAPQLYDRFENDRWLITKAGVSMKNLATKAVGPQHWVAKSIIILILAAVFFLFQPWYPGMRRVSASFQFMPVEKATLSAPYEGILETLGTTADGKQIVPGMKVRKGDVLARLDTFELQKRLAEARAREFAAMQQADGYRADPDKGADERIALFQAAAARAEAELYEIQIQQASIRAPMDGEVLVGDLRDKVGGRVKQGDELFVVAPTDNLQAELQVAERDIQDVVNSTGTGELATTSLPRSRFAFKIDRVVPMGEAKEGSNLFKVYATLQKRGEGWMPGLQGEARIDVREETWAWIWTRRFTDFVTMKWWSWSPF